MGMTGLWVRGARPVRRGRAAVLLVALALTAAACTGGDSDEDAPPTDTAAETEAGTGGRSEAPAADDAAVAAARTWLADTYGVDEAVLEGLTVAGIERSPNVSHVHFTQTVDGVPVDRAEIVVHVLDDGTVQNATDDLTDATPDDAEVTVDEAAAIDIAAKAITGTPGEPAATEVWRQDGQRLRRAWRIEIPTTDPVSSWTVLVDATNGAVISAHEASTGRSGPAEPRHIGDGAEVLVAQATGGADACEVTAPGACIFRPDPIYAAGGQLANPAQANDFLTPVPLEGLDAPTALVGEYVNAEPPGAPVPPTREQDGTWAGGRATPGFEAAMAYYWVDYVQRSIQALGFTDVLAEPFPVIPIDPSVVDNAFYSPSEGAIHLGVGSDGVNEGEDASGIIHEYGHALLDAQLPGLLASPEGGAYHESFGDLMAFLTTLEWREGDAGCLFAWAEAGECLRRVDSPKVYPDDLIREVHADGEIVNGAIHDVLAALLAADGIDIATCAGTDACNATRDRVLTTLLAANNYLPNDLSLPDVAEAFLLANDATFGGADADLIAQAFADHGLVGGGTGMVDSSGQAMGGDGAGVRLLVDIAHTYRGDLSLSAGVLDADFEELCQPITLFEPDAADSADNLAGQVDISDTACAAFVPPSPQQQWYLFVEDTLPQDQGQILQFAVVVEGTPYVAAGLPRPIPDADPGGTAAIVDGTGEVVPPGGADPMTDGVSGDGPFVSLAISHSYRGDLQIVAGVAAADNSILCSVAVLDPVPSDSTPDVAGDVDMAACAQHYPPTPDQRWFLLVRDTAALDEGTVDAFSVTGPDGVTTSFDGGPVAIPDADLSGIALLLDGSGGESGQAGGGGTSSGLPAVAIDLTHPYLGDLAVTAGVADPDGNVRCEVVVTAPDPTDDTADLSTEVSLESCVRFYPPSADNLWYVYVRDTLTLDEGTVDAVTLTGPDGATWTTTGVPAAVPDADPTGVVLLLDTPGAGGGGTPTAPGGPGGDITVGYRIAHTYAGDLDVVAGVADASGSVLCEVTLVTADLANATTDLSGTASLADCAARYPPWASQVWYLHVVDTAGQDTGTIEAFAIQGPDGTVHQAGDVPVAIPDADPNGAVATIRS